MTFEEGINILYGFILVTALYFLHIGNKRIKEEEESKETYIQTIGGIKFVVDDRDEIFRKENETIIVDKSKKLKYIIPNTSILYIQEGTEKN